MLHPHRCHFCCVAIFRLFFGIFTTSHTNISTTNTFVICDSSNSPFLFFLVCMLLPGGAVAISLRSPTLVVSRHVQNNNGLRSIPTESFFSSGGRRGEVHSRPPYTITTRLGRRTALALENTMTTSLHNDDGSDTKNQGALQFSSVLWEEHQSIDTLSKTALIVLNSPISNPPSPIFERLWEKSSFHACADGGANRLYQATTTTTTTTKERTTQQQKYIPHLIRGDLDSIWDHVQEYYTTLGTTIERDKCQDTNDLDKVLQVCQQRKEDISRVVIYGAFGGRFDQEMASLQALYKWGPIFGYQVFLYTDETFAFLVPANTSCDIQMPFYDDHIPQPQTSQQPNSAEEEEAGVSVVVGEGPTCGLIPIGCKCDSIVTDGLKWDLDGNMPMEFGGLVSTSNKIMKPILTVKSSHPVVFTAEILSSSSTE